MTGREVVELHRKWRKAKAEAIWAERARVRYIMSEARHDVSDLNENAIVRDNIRRSHRYDYFKPTIANFRRELEAYMRYAECPIQSRDTEYYSACGHDDYQYEMRENARRIAGEYALAISYLRSEL